MIEVFDLLTKHQVKEFFPGQLSLLQNNADLNLRRTREHYLRSVWVTESDHILVQILQHLPSRYDLNDEQYYNFCHSASKLTHRALNLNTESVLSGASPKSFFFGQGIKEFYLVEEIELPFDFKAKDLYPSLTPVRILSHPFTDLSFTVRDGRSTVRNNGMAFIAIDIGLLALQFREWVRANESADFQPSITQFVFQYPLLNMIPSDIDTSFFNRLRLQLGLVTDNEYVSRNGLAITDLRPLTDRVWGEWIKRASTAGRRFIDLPAQTPLLFLETLAEKLAIPDLYFNRQNLGIYTLAYLPYLTTLAHLCQLTGSTDNRQVYTYLERWYRRFVIGNYLSAIPGINPQTLQAQLHDEVLNPLQ